MNKIYKVLVMLLVLTMCVLAFVACNHTDPGNTPDGGNGDGGNGDGGNGDGGYTPPVFGNNSYAQVYVTTGTMSKLMMRDTTLEFADYDDSSYNTMINVDLEGTHQNFYGYGASLTHSSAYLLMQEGAEDVRREMLNELFGPDGARFNFVRIPIGSSDYIEGDKFFTCCDLTGGAIEDLGLISFNLSHDANLIAVLKEIVAINPNINILAVPWSAPAWMKTSGTLLGGSVEEKYEDVFADYLVKFVKEYKKQGITVTHLSLVNEPFVPILKYPTMQMDGLQAASIVKKLGPKLEKLDHDVKIVGWDHNINNVGSYLEELYEDEEASKYVAGAGFHGYDGDYTDAFLEDGLCLPEIYPDKEIYLTEITEHSGSNDFARNLSYAAQQVTIAPLNLGSNGAMFWNYVLRSDGTPTPVGHGNACYGVMDMNLIDGDYVYNKSSAYYSMAHVSRFAYPVNGVDAKALRVESSNDSEIIACALYRADGAIIVTACNILDSYPVTADIVIGDKSVTYTIQPQSVVTFVYNPSENALETEKEFYQAYNVTDVYVEQKQINTFLYKVKSDVDITANTKVYLTPYATLSADAQAVEYTIEGDSLVFTATAPYDRYFIHVVDGAKKALMPMARPMCSPTLTKGATSNVVTYNFVAGTSWSSFCDPAGKAVYRSAKGQFDETAEVVAQNVQISGVDSTTDTTPSADKPYYYVVLTSKNGVVTYVSAPLVDYNTAFSNVEVSVENVGGKAILVATGTFKVAGDVALDIYSADEKLGSVTEIMGDFVSGNAGDSFRVELDFTTIIKAAGAGVWFDVKLATGSGLRLEIPATAANTGNVVQIDRTTIEFKSWNNILKLTYAFYDVSVSQVIIDESDATRGPVLVVTGVVASNVRTVKLHYDAEYGGRKHDIEINNISTTDGEFRFELALKDLPTEDTPWCWFHIYVYKGNATVASEKIDLNRGPQLSIGQEFVFGNTKYIIQAWNGDGSQLTIQAVPIE